MQKKQNNSWHVSKGMQRSIDRSEDVYRYVEYPVCMISVAVLVAVVYRDINYFFSSLLCFMMEGVFYFSKL